MTFDCPRCHRPADERFYGPCADCRTILRTSVHGESRVVDVAPYEPKMNVTPNQVATAD